MRLFEETIVPYIGTDTFKLGEDLEEVRLYLKNNKIHFSQRIDSNRGCDPEVPWVYLTIADNLLLCFVENILFEIVFEGAYAGTLPNGGYVGIGMTEMKTIDQALEFNDEDEDFVSPEGYWIEEDLSRETVCSITVFLPEVNDDDFFSYEWIKNYRKN